MKGLLLHQIIGLAKEQSLITHRVVSQLLALQRMATLSDVNTALVLLS
jgi:hypothetical protein